MASLRITAPCQFMQARVTHADKLLHLLLQQILMTVAYHPKQNMSKRCLDLAVPSETELTTAERYRQS